MVVIIDDRGDVWDWSHNLIKVYPYDFFKGIGDINSSFLPKRQDVAVPDGPSRGASPPLPPSVVGRPATGNAAFESTRPQEAEQSLPSTADMDLQSSPTMKRLLDMSGGTDAAAMKEKSDEQDEQLKAQIADRPLLQEQIKLDQAEENAITDADLEQVPSEQDIHAQVGVRTDQNKTRHNLLNDDDDELEYLETALRNVHKRFFEEYLAAAAPSISGGRLAELRGERSPKKRPDVDLSRVPDVSRIMSGLKGEVLGATIITFSGVVPLGVVPAA